jgi:putative PEP-CTERM system TPR-repeat lipoprotein
MMEKIMRSLSTTVFVLAAGLMLASCSRDPVKARQEYIASGDQYFAQKNYPEAIIQYRNAVAQDGSYGEARAKLAEAYEASGDLSNALREWVRAADLMPDVLTAQLQAGKLLLAAGQYPEARDRATKVLATDPKNVNALIVLGNALANLKDIDGAVTQIDAAIDTEPRLAFAYLNKGLLELSRGDRSAAEAALKRATEIDPKSVAARLNLANFYWSSGKLAEAEEVFKGALELDPLSADVNRSMAAFYATGRSHATAEPYFKKLAEISPSVATRLGLADFYLEENRVGDAVSVLVPLSKEPDGFAPATLRLAAINFRQGKKPEAYQAVEDVLKQAPTLDAALEMKAGFLLADKKNDEVVNITTGIVGRNPRAVRSHFLRGSALALNGDTTEAINAFQQVLTLAPRFAPARIQIASLHILRGDGGAAVDLLAPVVRDQPTLGLARYVLGQGYLLTGNLPRAEAELSLAARGNPRSGPIQVWLGRLYAAKKDFPRARQAFERAIALQPESLEALNGLVTLDVIQKDLNAARRRLEPRIEASPNDESLLFLAATSYLSLGDHERSESLFKKVLEIDPNNINAYGRLGAIYLSQRRLDIAQKSFEDLASHHINPGGAMTMVGVILEIQGKPQEARKVYERVVEADPKAGVAANNLAWIYAESGENLDVALKLAQSAKSTITTNAQVSDTLGWIYFKKGLTTLAISTLREAASQQGVSAAVHYHLGLAYAKNGDVPAARKSLEQALALNPSFSGAADAKQVLATLKG